ncbi:6-phosphogluconolactonase [Parvularcula lutaonensis]|uniref:6-phosphogluconolactonase n=1 Tax=Parvularcula lutaonensis TaxID=491923 RepID=A0ABV7M8T5_9PROT|nr:6-phosphogluconolactonase [Parvularcula lutaonensis]GGY45667.1 6-phosphogluconolactonase [Parvularcula lutaonensis]
MSDFREFASRDALYEEAASRIASALTAAVSEHGKGHAALAGGSTPKPIYERMGRDGTVPWDKVVLTLTDERMAPPGDPASNEAMIRKALEGGPGENATLVPLFEETDGLPDQDIILLGMGTDGHFASLFPGAKELAEGLADKAPPVLKVVPDPLPAHAPFPRLSLSLPAILSAGEIIIAITGEEKRSVLDRAREDGPVEELPVRALLRSDHPNITFFWAP